MKKILKRLLQISIILFLLFSLLPYFFPVNTKELGYREMPYQNSNFIIVSKTKIHYRIWKPDSIKQKYFFIHGFSGSTFSFRKNIDTLLKNGALVIAMDLPSFGFSDKSDTADYTIDNTFKAINAILTIAHDKITKWDVVGHSMGAAIAGLYASNYPEKVNSLTLIDGTPFSEGTTSGFGKNLLKYPPLLRWADVVSKQFTDKKSFTKLLSSAYSCLADSNSVKGYMIPFQYKNSGSAIFRMAAAQNNITVNENNLKKLKKYIIWGSNDEWLPITGMRDFLKKYPETKGYIIKGAGHCPMETNWQEVNKILLSQNPLGL